MGIMIFAFRFSFVQKTACSCRLQTTAGAIIWQLLALKPNTAQWQFCQGSEFHISFPSLVETRAVAETRVLSPVHHFVSLLEFDLGLRRGRMSPRDKCTALLRSWSVRFERLA